MNIFQSSTVIKIADNGAKWSTRGHGGSQLLVQNVCQAVMQKDGADSTSMCFNPPSFPC